MTAGTSTVPGGSAPDGPACCCWCPPAATARLTSCSRRTKMGLDLAVASDGALPLGGHPVIPVHPGDPRPRRRADRLPLRAGRRGHRRGRADALLAGSVASPFGAAAQPGRRGARRADKARQRQRWAAAGVAQPRFEIVPAPQRRGPSGEAAAAAGFPCVVKAVSLSASQGVLRAGDAARRSKRPRRIRPRPVRRTAARSEPLLAEEYLPGPGAEHRRPTRRWRPDVTGSLRQARHARTGPRSRKPCSSPPPGCPGRHRRRRPHRRSSRPRARASQRPRARRTAHVTPAAGTAMLELAARSIGGLCSRALRFPGGKSLEELDDRQRRRQRRPGHQPGTGGPAGYSCSRCRARAYCARSRAAPTPKRYPGSPA